MILRFTIAVVSAGLVFFLSPWAGAEEKLTPAQLEFFEKNIRPILANKCYKCHSAQAEKVKGGLLLDTRDGLRKGGETGPALVAGQPNASLLIKAIRYTDKDLQMPPRKIGEKLPDTVIADFEKWVAMGAPDPRESVRAAQAVAPTWEQLFAERRRWWSLQPVRDPAVPKVKNGTWSKHPVDRFLLAKMEAQGLEPAPDADPRTLLRRVTFALTGLPPTPQEIAAFLADPSPDAYEKVVDRLLASPRFGERWARDWMDLVRYAETHGSEGDPPIPEAWRYRDYLIRAFNADVPCDQLIREHLAGDLLAQPRWNQAEGFNESLLGTVSLRMVEHGYQPVDTLDDQIKAVDNQIDVMSKSFQALTISCARCHDHKFDAISQRDYYALFGVFASVRPAQVTIDAPERLAKNRAALAQRKTRIKEELAKTWLAVADRIPALLQNLESSAPPQDETRKQIAALEHQLAAHVWQIMARAAGAPAATQERPVPVALWTFEGDARDLLGGLHGKLEGGAEIRDGRLVLDGKAAFVRTALLTQALREKTLEVWVSPATLDQRGGGVISVEGTKAHGFDSIVFAEKEPQLWMAGSDFFRRTRGGFGATETAKTGEWVHLAIAYGADGSITIYRNGGLYGPAYTPDNPLLPFVTGEAQVLFGLRHTGAGNGFFAGAIEEARLYDRALGATEIAASFQAGVVKISADDFARAFTPAEREHQTALTKQLAELRRAKAAQPADLWAGAVRDAANQTANPLHLWARLHGTREAEFAAAATETENRLRTELADAQRFNHENFKRAWDFAGGDYSQWFRYGSGLSETAVRAGEFSLEPEGERVVGGLFPAGALTDTLSQRHNGLLSSPRFKIETDSISVHAAGGNGAMVRLIVDNYPLGVGNIFPRAGLDKNEPGWVRLDTAYRKGSWAYLEFGTAEDLTRADKPAKEGRSWFAAERVEFGNKQTPREENLAWLPLLEGDAPKSVAALSARYQQAVTAAIGAWRAERMTEPQRALLDFFVRRGLLPNSLGALPELRPLIEEYRRLEAEVPTPRHAPSVLEARGYNAPLLPRGDHMKPGEPVPRAYLSTFGGQPFPTAQSGRLELARAITNPNNPLTARVMVNRIWQWLFGRGLVPTPDNFGHLGEKPTHPELLDSLARRFVEQGWSTKKMVRLLVTSRAWRLSSQTSAPARELDPANELYSHRQVRRLEAEAIRDELLAVSGRLDPAMFGPSVNAFASPDQQTRRSLYLTVRRTALSPFLTTFDAPAPFTTRGRRDATNVPAQSLTLLNDPFVIHLAQVWARDLMRSAPTSPSVRVREMFEKALGRSPSDVELAAALEYLAELATAHGIAQEQLATSERVWQDFAQSLFNLKEFIFLR